MPAVNSPLSPQVHTNRLLTQFAQRYSLNVDSYKAGMAVPLISVDKRSDRYNVYDMSDALIDEAEVRVDGEESVGGGYKKSKEPFYIDVKAYHTDIGEQSIANNDDPRQENEDATAFVTEKMLLSREVEVIETMLKDNVWNNGSAAPKAGQVVDWEAASSNPITDIKAAKRKVKLLCGYTPNTLLLSQSQYDLLSENEEILSRVSGGATTSEMAQVRQNEIAALLEVREIIISDAVKNNGRRGQASSNKFIAGENILLYFKPRAVSRNTPTAAIRFWWRQYITQSKDGYRITRFYLPQYKVFRIEGEIADALKISGSVMGWLFKGTAPIAV